MHDQSIAEKDAASRSALKHARALRRAEEEVIRAARMIADADPDKTYPWLHKSLDRLDRKQRTAA